MEDVRAAQHNTRLQKKSDVAAARSQHLSQAQPCPKRGIRTSQWRLEPDRFGGLGVFLPPLPEQRAIVAHIEAESAKLDALRLATERTIALLRERRTALIAAAVTGQIDVGSRRHYTDDAASQKEPERRR